MNAEIDELRLARVAESQEAAATKDFSLASVKGSLFRTVEVEMRADRERKHKEAMDKAMDSLAQAMQLAGAPEEAAG